MKKGLTISMFQLEHLINDLNNLRIVYDNLMKMLFCQRKKYCDIYSFVEYLKRLHLYRKATSYDEGFLDIFKIQMCSNTIKSCCSVRSQSVLYIFILEDMEST